MNIFTRFFGHDERDDHVAQLIMNPRIDNHLSLQVLFKGKLNLDVRELTSALRSFHDSLADARCEVDPTPDKDGKIFGIIGWANHVVKLIGVNSPMAAAVVESCVAPAHYAREQKERARRHDEYLILYYTGYETSPLEQYVALAVVAGAFSRFGGIVVLNESAYTSLPTEALSAPKEVDDTIEFLRSLPLASLYCGFVKYEVDDMPGVWTRTFGAYLLGLPDLAAHAAAHDDGQKYYNVFNHIYRQLRESGVLLAAGYTMQLGDDELLEFREATKDEYFLEDHGKVLVVEIVERH